MYSVILTELGIPVFSGGVVDRTFPFKDVVGEYLSIKKKEASLDQLVEYLNSLQRGVKTSDASLLELLKKSSIDAQMMDEKELEEIQSSKPQIIVDSGFAKDVPDALGKLRDFSLGLTSSQVTEVLESPDLYIVRAIDSLDEIDKIANVLSSRMREWYGLHFPELENIVDGINGYAQVVLGGRRGDLTKDLFEGAGFTESNAQMVVLVASKSIGGKISDANLSMVQSLARQIAGLHELRRGVEMHIDAEMRETAPNLTAIVGPTIGARLMRKAGSLKRLASLPASTIQVLGAEKALFRALKTGSQPPKHGLLFQHQLVHGAPRWQRGKIARAIAAKTVIAARVDVYGEGINEMLLEKLNVRVSEIGKRYEKPPERKPGTARRGGENSGRAPERGRGRRAPGDRPGQKKKKRKKFGRR